MSVRKVISEVKAKYNVIYVYDYTEKEVQEVMDKIRINPYYPHASKEEADILYKESLNNFVPRKIDFPEFIDFSKPVRIPVNVEIEARYRIQEE